MLFSCSQLTDCYLVSCFRSLSLLPSAVVCKVMCSIIRPQRLLLLLCETNKKSGVLKWLSYIKKFRKASPVRGHSCSSFVERFLLLPLEVNKRPQPERQLSLFCCPAMKGLKHTFCPTNILHVTHFHPVPAHF